VLAVQLLVLCISENNVMIRELLKTLGVPLQVDDLYSLDAETLASMQPIYALIFLFKWVGGTDEKGGAEGEYDEDFFGFFAHQVSLMCWLVVC
jgi:Ubiquitin carboxyl-terminal hydrolase, family 1